MNIVDLFCYTELFLARLSTENKVTEQIEFKTLRIALKVLFLDSTSFSFSVFNCRDRTFFERITFRPYCIDWS